MKISLPCRLEGDTYKVKSLGIKVVCKDPKEASKMLATAVETALGLSQITGELLSLKPNQFELILPYLQPIYDHILELEPLPMEREQKRLKGRIETPTAQEIVDYGY